MTEGRRLACAVFGVEVRLFFEAVNFGRDDGREIAARRVVIPHGVVVILPRDGDAILRAFERVLKLLETLARTQLRIVLG